MGFLALVRNPVLLVRRHRNLVENAAVAAALALLVGIFLQASAVFPAQWHAGILLTIFVLGAYSRAWGYYAAVAALLWPLWLLSPFLTMLFLAGALLSRARMIAALPWVLLAVSAPLLAEWHVIGFVPLLAGLIAGPATGLWSGLLAALWLKMAGGLAGWLPEMGALHGAPFALDLFQARIGDANPIETLLLLIRPFAQPSPVLHALQIAAWGLAGGLVGRVRRIEWQRGEPRYPLVPALASGALLLWGALYLVPAWLELQPLAAFLFAPSPAVGLALSALLAALGATLYEFLPHPRPRPVPPRPTVHMSREGPITVSKVQRRGDHIRPGASAEEDELIMLELD
ncbi:MAG: hypothetical protein ACRDIB_11235 [Ardenticatenaceae bacterium]